MTFTNRPENVLNLQIFPIYSLGKNPRNSPFSVVELYEGKVAEIRDFANSNSYSSNTKERESQVHMAN